AGRSHRLRGERDGRRGPGEGLQGHEHPHAVARGHHRAAADLPADRALAAGDDAVNGAERRAEKRSVLRHSAGSVRRNTLRIAPYEVRTPFFTKQTNSA